MKKYATLKRKGEKKNQIEVDSRVVLNKEEYQTWRNLHDKKLHITQKRFRNYVDEVRKANAKLNKIANDPNYFMNDNIKLLEDIGFVNEQSELDTLLNKPSQVLAKDYEFNLTKTNIDRLQENVDRIFGEGVINFKQLSPRQLNKFFEDNGHLVYLIYYPDDVKANNVVEMTGGVNAINKNINYIKTK